MGENVDTEAVFNQVLDRNDYASVTIICEGDEDRQYSAILYGRATAATTGTLSPATRTATAD